MTTRTEAIEVALREVLRTAFHAGLSGDPFQNGYAALAMEEPSVWGYGYTAPQPAPSVEDYTEVIADNARLLRELDVALNGANATKQAPSVEKAIRWPNGYCLDPNGRMVTPAGRHEDFAFGYEIGSAEAMAIKAHATQAKSAPAPSVPDGWRLVRSLLDEIDALVGETGGVYGLHQNGDASPWDEILPGGQFERLSSLDDVREIIDAEQPSETAAGLLPAGMIEDEI